VLLPYGRFSLRSIFDSMPRCFSMRKEVRNIAVFVNAITMEKMICEPGTL